MDGRLTLGGVVIDRGGSEKRPAPDRWDREASRTLSAGVDLLARRRFVALEFVMEGSARRVPVFGQLDHLPELTPANQSDLALGLPLILGEHRDRAPTGIYLIRRVHRAGKRRAERVVARRARPLRRRALLRGGAALRPGGLVGTRTGG